MKSMRIELLASVCLIGVWLAGLAVGAEPPAFRVVSKGAVSGIREPRQTVIKDQTEWEKFWTLHQPGQGTNRKPPVVDFTKEIIIALTLGQQRTGGYAIAVTGVEAAGDRLRISVKRSAPKPGMMVTQALTAPFCIVAAPRSELKPEFLETK